MNYEKVYQMIYG